MQTPIMSVLQHKTKNLWAQQEKVNITSHCKFIFSSSFHDSSELMKYISQTFWKTVPQKCLLKKYFFCIFNSPEVGLTDVTVGVASLVNSKLQLPSHLEGMPFTTTSTCMEMNVKHITQTQNNRIINEHTVSYHLRS